MIAGENALLLLEGLIFNTVFRISPTKSCIKKVLCGVLMARGLSFVKSRVGRGNLWGSLEKYSSIGGGQK